MIDITFGKYHSEYVGDALVRGAESSLTGISFRHRRGRLWRRKTLLAGAFVFAIIQIRDCMATSSEVDLGNPGTLSAHRTFSFDQLNNIQFVGQSLSLDFTFTNNEFVRLFTITSPLFSAQIDLQTSGIGQLGILQGTGHLVDINAQPIPGFGVTGNASGDGSLIIGLFPLLKDQNGTPDTSLARPLDFFSIHFDLILPNIQNPSIHVTGGDFGLFSDADRPFGIGPGLPLDIVPDSGGTLVLLSMALGSMVVVKVRCQRKMSA